MGRSKPRYPLQLDNAFVGLCYKFEIDPYSMECMLVACACLCPLGEFGADEYREPVERMLQKLALRFPGLPNFTIVVQGKLNVD